MKLSFELAVAMAAVAGVAITWMQTAAIKETNSLAKSSIDSADINHQLDQRAFLSFDMRLDAEPARLGPLTPGNSAEEDRLPMAIYPLTNHGPTPALRARLTSTIVFEAAPPKQPDWAKVAESRRQLNAMTAKGWNRSADDYDVDQAFTVFPGNTQRFYEVVWPSGPTWFEDYGSGKKQLYAWVRVDYCDVFGTAHWTQACFAHNYPAGTRQTIAFSYCPGSGITTEETVSEKSTYACR